MLTFNTEITWAGVTSVTIDADKSSDPILLKNIAQAMIQIKFGTGGTPAGTFKLQVSNDPGRESKGGAANVTEVTNWTDYTGSSQAITTDGDHAWNLANIGYKWARVVYTRTSGSATLTGRVNGKGWV